MADPPQWQDPPWYPEDADQYDWRWFISAPLQAEWLNLSDEQKWEMATAAQRLAEQQRRMVESQERK